MSHWDIFDMPIKEMDDLVMLGHTWVEIAKLKGTTTKTILKWRHRVNYVDPKVEIGPDLLDDIIIEFIAESPQIGYNTVESHLNQQGSLA